MVDIGLEVLLGEPAMDKVTVYRSRSKLLQQRWYWRRVAANGKKLSRSSEGYRDEPHATRMALRCNPDRKQASIVVEF